MRRTTGITGPRPPGTLAGRGRGQTPALDRPAASVGTIVAQALRASAATESCDTRDRGREIGGRAPSFGENLRLSVSSTSDDGRAAGVPGDRAARRWAWTASATACLPVVARSVTTRGREARRPRTPRRRSTRSTGARSRASRPTARSCVSQDSGAWVWCTSRRSPTAGCAPLSPGFPLCSSRSLNAARRSSPSRTKSLSTSRCGSRCGPPRPHCPAGALIAVHRAQVVDLSTDEQGRQKIGLSMRVRATGVGTLRST